MAEIPIEKKGGSKWWLWLLLLLAVILLLWLFLGNDDDEEPLDEPMVAEAPVDTGTDLSSGPITSLAMLTGTTDGSLVGRDVRLNGVPVGDVEGDASFWITGDDGNRVYVILDEIATPDTAIEGQVDVDAGDSVDIVGTVRSASEGAPEDAAMGTPTDPLPEGITQYILAQSATVVS